VTNYNKISKKSSYLASFPLFFIAIPSLKLPSQRYFGLLSMHFTTINKNRLALTNSSKNGKNQCKSQIIHAISCLIHQKWLYLQEKTIFT